MHGVVTGLDDGMTIADAGHFRDLILGIVGVAVGVPLMIFGGSGWLSDRNWRGALAVACGAALLSAGVFNATSGGALLWWVP